MTTPDGSQKKFKWRNFWQRRSVRIVAFVGLLIAAVLIFLPLGAKLYMEKWLVDNGADSATIERVRLNPFTGVAALEGVDVEKGGRQVFRDSTIFFNIGLRNLLDHEAVLQQATIADLLVEVERDKDGSIRVGSYSIPFPLAGDDASKVTDKLEEKVPWIFRAQVISLKNVVLRFHQPDLAVDLVIEEALLEKFNTDPNSKDGTLVLKATVNGAPVNLDLPILRIKPRIDVRGKVTVADARLDDLSGFLGKYLKPFSGVAGLQGEVAFTMDDDGLRVDYDGLIDLQNGDIGGGNWTTKGVVNWQGKAAFAMTPGNMVVDVDGSLHTQKAAFAMPDPRIDIDNPDILITGKTTVTIGDEVVVDSGASLKLAPTTFAMDILKTAAGDTSWDGTVRVETGTATKGLMVKTVGKLHVAEAQYSMEVKNALMEVDSRMLSWDGEVEYAMGIGAENRDYVRTNGIMEGEATTFSLPEVAHVTQKGLNLKGKTEVALGSEIGVSYDGEILLDETGAEAAGIAANDKKLSWAGKVDYLLGDTHQTIGVDGDLAGEEIVTDVPEANLHISQQSIKATAGFSLVLRDKPAFSGASSFNASGLQIRQGDTMILTLGEISLPKIRENGSGGVVADSLDLKELIVPSSKDIPVGINASEITLAGVESPDFAHARAARLTISQPEVIDNEGATQLVHLDSMTAEEIAIDKDLALTAGKITAAGGVFLTEKGKEPAARMAKLNIAKIYYSTEAGFSGDTAELDSLFADIHRQKTNDAQAEKKTAAGVSASQPTNGQPAADNHTKASGMPVKIGTINIVGKSGFTFTDETLAQTFTTVFDVKSLQINDIDLSRPDHPFSYALEGTFDKYSPLQVTGKIAPLADNIFAEQEGTLRNYSMMRASPYAVEAIGTYFPSGILNYTSTLKLGEGKINMGNNLVFRNLEVETVNNELAGKLNKKLPVPLDLALSMLRDNDGTIDLEIPLSGDLSDFKIGIADIVVTALSKGITTAVTPYLAYTALGPAGALVFLGAKAGKSMLHTNLPSLEFALNKRDLTEQHKEILDKVGKTIEKNNTKSYTICAKTSVDEISTIDNSTDTTQGALLNKESRQELFDLGESRSLAVKKYLLDKFNIGEERLLICNPGVEFTSGIKPTVNFMQ